jgi:glycosyltransferase involved in cell wall biosynthesis
MHILTDKYILVRVWTSVGNSITFQNISNEKINMIYNACYVLLIPTIEVELGLPIVEGFATNIPAVAFDIEVFHEIGEDAVEYINPIDVLSLIDGIKAALNNKYELTCKGGKIAAKFSFNVFKEKLLVYCGRLP